MFDAAAVAAMIALPAGADPVDGQPDPSGATAPMASGGGTAEVDEPRPPSYTPPRLVAAVLPWPRCSPLPRVLPRLTGSPSRVTPPRRRLPAASGGGTAEVGEPRLPSYTPPRIIAAAMPTAPMRICVPEPDARGMRATCPPVVRGASFEDSPPLKPKRGGSRREAPCSTALQAVCGRPLLLWSGRGLFCRSAGAACSDACCLPGARP